MWMSDPTPVTTRSIVSLKRSSVRPNGTVKTPGKSIQVIVDAVMFGRMKIRQLQAKLRRTAPTLRRTLNLRARRVNKVMSTAATPGAKRIVQGR